MKLSKKLLIILTIFIIIFINPTTIVAANITSYTDVPSNHWAYNAIMELTRRGIINGTTKEVNKVETFNPNKKTTTAEFITMISNLLYKEQLNNYNYKTEKWYEKNYYVCLNNYLFSSYEITLSELESIITREKMAMLLIRAQEVYLNDYKYDLLPTSIVPDYYQIDDLYKTSVIKAYSMKLITGVDNNRTFNPKGLLTRAEAATVIYRLINLDQNKEQIISGNNTTLDLTNISKGYVKIKTTSNSKIKVKIIKVENSKEYIYNLNSNNIFETFPLSEGSGTYNIRIYEHTYDNKYRLLDKNTITVNLDNDYVTFINTNQYVNFDTATNAINIANSLTKNIYSTSEKINILYSYVSNNIEYDYNKAQTVKSGYTPNIDNVLRERKGICFDYAAVLTVMLRSQNIPCKMVIGYVDGRYHAWVNVYNEKSWILLDPTFSHVNINNYSYISKYYY